MVAGQNSLREPMLLMQLGFLLLGNSNSYCFALSVRIRSLPSFVAVTCRLENTLTGSIEGCS